MAHESDAPFGRAIAALIAYVSSDKDAIEARPLDETFALHAVGRYCLYLATCATL